MTPWRGSAVAWLVWMAASAQIGTLPAEAGERVVTREYQIDLADDGLPTSWRLVGPWAELAGEESIVLWQRQGEEAMLALEWQDFSSSYGDVRTEFLGRSQEEQAIRLMYRSTAGNGLEVDRTYVFPREGLETRLTIRLSNPGNAAIPSQRRGPGPSLVVGPGLGQPPVDPGGLATKFYSYVRPAFLTEDGLVSSSLQPDSPELEAARVRWVALHSRYFAVALVPQSAGQEVAAKAWLAAAGPERGSTSSETAAPRPSVRLVFPQVQLDPGRHMTLEASFFLGPKTRRTLGAVKGAGGISAGLDELLFPALWDWLRWLCFVLMNVLRGLHGWTGSWAAAILLLAVFVRIITFPLAQIGLREQAKFKAQQDKLRPHLEELNQKYADRPEQRTEALFALYKQHGVNPLAPMRGCLWVGLQIPIFVALFNLLGQAYELHGAQFLWIRDLSAPDRLFPLGVELPFLGAHFNLLPLVMAASQVLVSRLSASGDLDQGKAQSRAMALMALAFFLLFYTFPAGLVLYWTASNLLQLAQHLGSRLWWRAHAVDAA